MRCARGLATVLLAVAIPSSLLATTVQVLSVERLTETSSDVVRARVQTIDSYWNQDRTAIYTRVMLRNEQVLRGDVPAEFTVLLPGGSVEGRTSIVIGAPEFKPQQEVVLFLNQVTVTHQAIGLTSSQMGGYQLTDLFQGMFDVVVDPATGEAAAVSNVVKLVDRPEIRPETLELGEHKGLSMSELERRIGSVR